MKAKITKSGKYKVWDNKGRMLTFKDADDWRDTTYTYDFWEMCLRAYELDYCNPVTITIEGAIDGPIVLKSNHDE